VGEHQRMRLPAGAVNVAVPAPRDDRHRVHLLGSLIRTHTQDSRCLVFTRTKRDAAALAEMEGLADISMALHGDMSQALRERALDAFRQGTVRCLVATDVAARGLDIPAVEAVIHYSLPSNTESFVHRSGRTARAGRSGHNIVLFTPSEHVMLAQLEREVGFQFQIRAAPKLQEVLQRSMLTAVENAAGVS
ncbi:MAG: helicase-related protein, partial [Hydrogenophaga sp.]